MTIAIPADARERRKIAEVAREYRRAEYEVIVDPDPSQVPAFLGRHRPDLIATSSRESVIIEVKSTRGFDRSEQNRDIAAQVARQPGWRFELVVTGPRRDRDLDAPQPWDLRTIDDQLQQARALLGTDQWTAAFLLLWADTEALLRHLAQREGVEAGRLFGTGLVRELTTQGLLSRSDYGALDQAAALRNRLVHGTGSPEVDPTLLEQLLTVVEALREDAGSYSPEQAVNRDRTERSSQQ